LLVLKRTESDEEKGKDDRDDDDDDDDYDYDDDDVFDQATFDLQPAAHYGFRHLFILRR
jgi:hypothetical protein